MLENLSSIELQILGKVESPFKQKFAIPRQPGLAPHAKGSIKIEPPFNQPTAFEGLSEFSHIWVSFIFHETMDKGWKPQVRPPRLGGNEKIGVFATRSTFRPNPLGLSVLKLEKVDLNGEEITLLVSGLDLLDGTPVVDIKPYIPYSDQVSNADGGFANEKPSELLTVVFIQNSLSKIDELESKYPDLKLLIEEVLQQDPRPAYKKTKSDNKEYAVFLYDLNIKWRVIGDQVEVISIEDT